MPESPNNSPNNGKSKQFKLPLWAIILIGLMLFWLSSKLFAPASASLDTLSYSSLLYELSEGNVVSVMLLEDEKSLVVEFKNPVSPDSSEKEPVEGEEPVVEKPVVGNGGSTKDKIKRIVQIQKSALKKQKKLKKNLID